MLRLAQPALTAVAFVVLWALDAMTVQSALIAASAASALVLVVGLARSVRRIGVGPVDLRLGRTTLWYGARGQGATVANHVTARLDVAMLPAFVSAASVGLYSVATSVSLIVYQLANTFAGLVIPAAARDPERGPIKVVASFWASLAIAGAGAVVLALLAQPLLGLVYGADFEDASTSLLLLLPGGVLFAGSSILNAGIYAAGRPFTATCTQILGMVVTVVGLVVFLAGGGVDRGRDRLLGLLRHDLRQQPHRLPAGGGPVLGRARAHAEPRARPGPRGLARAARAAPAGHAVDGVGQPLLERLAREALGVPADLGAVEAAEVAAQRAGEGVAVAGRHEHAGAPVDDGLAGAARVDGDDRPARGLRLDGGDAELLDVRDDQRARPRVERARARRRGTRPRNSARAAVARLEPLALGPRPDDLDRPPGGDRGLDRDVGALVARRARRRRAGARPARRARSARRRPGGWTTTESRPQKRRIRSRVSCELAR